MANGASRTVYFKPTSGTKINVGSYHQSSTVSVSSTNDTSTLTFDINAVCTVLSSISSAKNYPFEGTIDSSYFAVEYTGTTGSMNPGTSAVTKDITTKTAPVSRGTSAKTVSITISMTIKSTNSNYSGSGNSSVSLSATVPALPSYTITYDANGGSNPPSSSTKYYGINLTLTTTAPTAPSGGWSFKGWSTSTTAALSGTTITIWSDNTAKTVYACWQRDVKQAYNLNGGSGTTPSTQTLKQYRSGSSVSTANFTTPSTSGITAPSGWAFSSWSTSNAATGGTTYGASATSGFAPAATSTGTSLTRTLYARWSRSVKFYGGTSNAQIGSAVTQYRGGTAYSTITPPGVPTAISGWIALGWRDDTSAAAKLYGGNSTSAFSYTGTKTAFYAVYSRSIDCYSGISKATTTAGTQYRNGGTYAVAPPGITSLSTYSWTSLGWRDDTTSGAKEYGANNTNLFAYSGNGPLYAVYSRTLELSYTNGGGTGTGPTASTTGTQYYNTNGGITSPSVTLAANTFTKAGYYFSKWSIGNAGASVSVSCAVNASRTSPSTAAQWTAYKITLKYHVNGGTIPSGAASGTTYFRTGSDSLVESSTDQSTWTDVTAVVSADTEYVNLWNVASFGAIKTGYSITGTAAYNTAANGSGVNINQDYSASSTTNPVTVSALNGGAALTSDKTITIYINWKINSYTLTINPNGGYWNGTTANSTATQNYNTTKSIAPPTRTGYRFVGWAEMGSGSINKFTSSDPSFDSSSGGVGVYNNSSNGAVTHTLQTSSAGYGNREILITTANTTVSPGLGGFVQTTTSAANKKYIHTFVAKIPTGYYVMNAQNSTGDGRTITWLTPKDGTGTYQVYAYQHNCGSTGSFSTFGHVYIYTGTKPVSWQLAYSCMWDITDGTTVTYTYGAGAGTLIALWAPLIYTKVNGLWKGVSLENTKVSGAWKNITAGYTKVSGAWKTIF